MTGHVIVCGLGHVGHRIVHLLCSLGERVVVVTMPTRDAWRRSCEEAGARIVEGDARDERMLAAADIAGASALIAATNHDITNIEITLDARRLHPDLPVVARLFDQALARELEASLDVRRAPAKSALAAPTFAAASLGASVIGAFALDETMMVVSRIQVDAGSPLLGREPDALMREQGVMLLGRPPGKGPLSMGESVIAIAERGDFDKVSGISERNAQARLRRRAATWAHYFAPGLWMEALAQMWRNAPRILRAALVVLFTLTLLSVFIFHWGMGLSFVDALYFVITTISTTGYGDITPKDAGTALKLYGCILMLLGSASTATLYSLVTDFVVAERFRQGLSGRAVSEGGHVVVVGLGNLGYRILGELRRGGVEAVAVALSETEEFAADVRQHHALVVGDARMRATLHQAGVGSAAAVIAVTGDDAVNLSVGLATRQLSRAARTVVRLFDADFARKVERGLGLDGALSASAIAAPTFVAAALYEGVRDAFVIDGELVTLWDHDEPDAWVGLTPEQVAREFGEQILLRKPRHGGGRYVPALSNEPLRADEHVLVATRRTLEGPASRFMA